MSALQQLGCIGTVVPPVTELMDAALKAESGQLPAAEAAKLGNAASAAITKAAAQMSSTAPAAPARPRGWYPVPHRCRRAR